jgi:hypothetical protein
MNPKESSAEKTSVSLVDESKEAQSEVQKAGDSYWKAHNELIDELNSRPVTRFRLRKCFGAAVRIMSIQAGIGRATNKSLGLQRSPRLRRLRRNFERSDARFEAEVQRIYAMRPETCVLSVELRGRLIINDCACLVVAGGQVQTYAGFADSPQKFAVAKGCDLKRAFDSQGLLILSMLGVLSGCPRRLALHIPGLGSAKLSRRPLCRQSELKQLSSGSVPSSEAGRYVS